MSTVFTIAEPASRELEVEEGQSGTLDFTVTNSADAFRNLGVRVAVLNSINQEDPWADERSYFTAAGPANALLSAGQQETVTVTCSPAVNPARRDISWTLIAFDADQSDEVSTSGQPCHLKITEKKEGAVVVPPPEKPPMWIWAAVGGGVLAIIIGIIIAVAGSGEPEEPTTPPVLAATAPTEIFFRTFIGDVSEGVGGVTVYVDGSAGSPDSVTTHLGGEGGTKVCELDSPAEGCHPTSGTVRVWAKKTGYKNVPAATYKLEDLRDAPKIYISMVKASSGGTTLPPILVYPVDIEIFEKTPVKEWDLKDEIIFDPRTMILEEITRTVIDGGIRYPVERLDLSELPR